MDNQKRTENAIDRAEAMTKMLAENVKSDEEDNKSLCEYDQGHLDGIEVGYEIAMQKINKVRAEILEERQKNMNGEYDKIFELCILTIDKYKAKGEPNAEKG